ARLVAVGVVDGLEVVDVEKNEAERRLIACQLGRPVSAGLVEIGPIEKSGQAIALSFYLERSRLGFKGADGLLCVACLTICSQRQDEQGLLRLLQNGRKLVGRSDFHDEVIGDFLAPLCNLLQG